MGLLPPLPQWKRAGVRGMTAIATTSVQEERHPRNIPGAPLSCRVFCRSVTGSWKPELTAYGFCRYSTENMLARVGIPVGCGHSPTLAGLTPMAPHDHITGVI